MNINKKGMNGVVIMFLLLLVSVVGFIGLNVWYTNLVEDYENKKLFDKGDMSSNSELMGLKYVNQTTYLLVRSYTPGYKIINKVISNSEECWLEGNNVILGNSLNEIKLSNCLLKSNNLNDIGVVTKFGVKQGRVSYVLGNP